MYSNLSPTIVDAFYQALSVLLLISLPVLLASIVAGTLAGAFQAATNIRESALNYGLKLLALIVLGYLFYPTAAEQMLAFSQVVFR